MFPKRSGMATLKLTQSFHSFWSIFGYGKIRHFFLQVEKCGDNRFKLRGQGYIFNVNIQPRRIDPYLPPLLKSIINGANQVQKASTVQIKLKGKT